MVKFICGTFPAPSLQIPIKFITICYRYATASIMWLVPILEAIRETSVYQNPYYSARTLGTLK